MEMDLDRIDNHVLVVLERLNFSTADAESRKLLADCVKLISVVIKTCVDPANDEDGGP